MNLTPVKYSDFKNIPEELQQPCLRSGVVVVGDPVFELWNLPEGTTMVVLMGGRGGMKTYGVSDFIAHQAAVNKKRCVILRDEKSTIKESILAEIQQRYEDIPIRTNTYMTATGMKEVDNPNDLVFTMGFRASSNKKQANMKGVSNIDIAFVEEAEDIIDPVKFDTFTDSLRKEGCLVIVILNTPDIGHFILKRYFDTTTAIPVPAGMESYKLDYDGFFVPTPRKDIPGFVGIITDFTTNEFLPAAKIADYYSYGDPKSHKFNLHYFLSSIMGYSSTGRKGQILKKVKPITLKEYLALPFKEFYGQDFGTASPAGMVGVKFDKNNCYCREINYKPMNTLTIGKKYCQMGLGPSDKVIADSADKDACDKLSGGWLARDLEHDDLMKYPGLVRGFFVEKCVKGEGSITAGLSIMDGMNLFAVVDIPVGYEQSNLWEEIRMYVYEQNKSGEYTNDPKDDKNHLIDPWRYVVVDQRGKKEMFGI